MKIAIATNVFSDTFIGGSNVYASRLVQELVKRGHELCIITVDPSRKKEVIREKGFTKYTIRPFNIAMSQSIGNKSLIHQALWTLLDLFDLYCYAQMCALLKKEKPDVVHVHTPVNITLAVFFAARKLNIPVVFTAHDYLLLCRKVICFRKTGERCTNSIAIACHLYRILTRWALKNRVSRVIFPSAFIMKKFEKEGYFKDLSKTVLPYGLQVGDSLNKNHRSNKDTDVFNILYVGSLTSHKGIDILIKAVRNIEDENIRVHIVGTGRYENYLRSLAHDDKRIIFDGKVINANISQFYERAHVVVVPSIWDEVLGIVIQEAFRAEVPVIASRIGGISELVEDGVNGYLFTPGDVYELNSLIVRCMHDRKNLTALGRNGKEKVCAYDIQKHTDVVITEYERAIEFKKV